jgi:hypothetical protein
MQQTMHGHKLACDEAHAELRGLETTIKTLEMEKIQLSRKMAAVRAELKIQRQVLPAAKREVNRASRAFERARTKRKRDEDRASAKKRAKHIRLGAKHKNTSLQRVNLLGDPMEAVLLRDMFPTEESQGRWWSEAQSAWAVKPSRLGVYEEAGTWHATRKGELPMQVAPLPLPLPLTAPI